MTTQSPPQATSVGSTGTARFALLLVALIWPAQLLTAAGVATGMTSAAIAQHFQTTQIAWFGLAYTIVATVLTPVVARLGDRYGKKRVMLAITAIGLVGDLLVVLSPAYPGVLVGRALAGCYGPIAALAFAAARDIFPPKRVGLASSLIGSSLGLTVALVPLLSGYLLDWFGFRGPLWFVVAGIVVAFALLTTLPDMPGHPTGQRFDVLGSVLLGAATVSLVYGLGQGTAWGWDSPRILGLFAVTVLATVAFVIVERRTADPVVDLRMLTRRNVATVLGGTGLMQGTLYSVATVLTLLALFPAIPGVSAGLGWSGTKIALVTLAGQSLLFATGFLVGKMSARWDPRKPWWAGAAITIAGLLSYAFLHHTIAQIAFSAIVLGLGSGLAIGAVPLLILGSVSPEEQGMANGMNILINGLINAITAQLIFVVMARSGVVLKGTQFYSDASFRDAYLLSAGLAAVALLITLAIPRVLKTSEIHSGGQ
ncbi:MFS transporter [Cryptosporangium aurantiacum]|uniref:Major Facilitator Superfamily protein n=1 Tax=Cryptosporangium aurantiacum TaxID=134849 RepID=A0A1M7RF79_9ACTN|nr:MFS transporter [Cryptosporangium aurantiacum]SHN44947.1 Major Facilitator Superfamily protein [Cryptosporangium aurantiacum]